MTITPRLLFLRNKWNARLIERQAMDSSHPRHVNPMDFLIDVDPTKKREYTDWLCRTYVSGNFRYEDRDRVKITLELFNRHKHRLPVEDRDIGRMKTEQDVWHIVERFLPKDDEEEPTPGGREKRRQERAKALAESDIDDSELSGDWIVASPNTHFASQWWGRGTRWCTAMETSEHYDAYMKTSPLRIFITPDGSKLQAHIASMTICDEEDIPLDFKTFAKQLPVAAIELLRSDLIQCIHKADPSVLDYPDKTPKELLDDKTTNELIKKLEEYSLSEVNSSHGAWALRILETKYSEWLRHLHRDASIPKQIGYARQEGSVVYLSENNRVTNAFPFHSRQRDKENTDKTLNAIVKTNDTTFIKACADELMDAWRDKMIGSNIVNQFMAIIPDDCKSNKFWKAYTEGFAAYTRNKDFISPPDQYLNENNIRNIARFNLTRIPLHMMTKEILIEGLYSSGSDGKTFAKINDLFSLMKEEEIIDFAIFGKGVDVEYLPEKYITPNLAKNYVEARPAHIGRLDLATEFNSTGRSAITEELCFRAIELSQAAISSIPRRMLSPEMCLYAIENHRFAINDIPKDMRTVEMYVESIRREPDTISHVHTDKVLIPYETFLSAVSSNSSHLGIVPLPYRTTEMCIAAINSITQNDIDNLSAQIAEKNRISKMEEILKHVPPKVARQIPAFREIIELRPSNTNFIARGYANDIHIMNFEPYDHIPEALPRLFKDSKSKEYQSLPMSVMEIMEEFEEAMRENSSPRQLGK